MRKRANKFEKAVLDFGLTYSVKPLLFILNDAPTKVADILVILVMFLWSLPLITITTIISSLSFVFRVTVLIKKK
jgi:hypothetical protein